jgi:hypothetical protein
MLLRALEREDGAVAVRKDKLFFGHLETHPIDAIASARVTRIFFLLTP